MLLSQFAIACTAVYATAERRVDLRPRKNQDLHFGFNLRKVKNDSVDKEPLVQTRQRAMNPARIS